MNRILVTGAAGFLAVNLTEHLLEDENNLVFGLDNFSSSSISNIYSLLKNDRYRFLEQDVKERIALSVDCVYHLAGCGDFKKYFEDKSGFLFDEIQNIKAILDYASQTGAKFIYAGSFAEFTEEKRDFFPFYNAQNLIFDLILEFASKNKLDAKIVRLTDVYGKNMLLNDARFIPKTIFSAFHNEDIIIERDEKKFYTFAQDIAVALKKITDNYTEKGVIDVASPSLQLKSDIARLILNFTKSKSRIIVKNENPLLPSYSPEIEYLNTMLDFRAKTPILEGISKTIDFFKLMYFS